MSKIVYDTNNSGGSWWLTDQNWRDLEAAGWKVAWMKDDEFWKTSVDSEGRWLGALAKSAHREELSMAEAIEEWERVTGENSADLGCSCCGTPHSFHEELDDGRIGEWWSPEYPMTGQRYS